MRVRRSTTKGGTSPPSRTSSKKMTLRSMRASLGLDRPFGHDERVARVRHDLVARVAVLALHQDEQHLAAARPLLLEDVLGARAHPELPEARPVLARCARSDPTPARLRRAPRTPRRARQSLARLLPLRHRPMSCATISRFQVASPKVTSELFARLK